eukprot:CAMPEP_0184679556 /NCGR_PEP_ID=MMETSP0312-20130426/2393_1 /TAXON_ID=31354 /ORGANISM="Compsopogon coeruleus, Strain SAG 36.94" /LENGTH=171 /DNA_ID=CAMNT_0027129073 /DNA_START=67 /DNA_END=582 /DNA_ORIENTATION=-
MTMVLIVLMMMLGCVVDGHPDMAMGDGERIQMGVLRKVDAGLCTRRVVRGDTVTVHHEGRLEDGTVFESSYPTREETDEVEDEEDEGEPVTFRVGEDEVIAGWNQGVLGMCVGEIRKLIIPPSLGYGEVGSKDKNVPERATLKVKLELLRFEAAAVAEESVPAGKCPFGYG